MSPDEWVSRIKRHAQEHYEDGGWDVVVECWSDDEIRRVVLEDLERGDDPMESFESLASIWRDREQDAKNSAF